MKTKPLLIGAVLFLSFSVIAAEKFDPNKPNFTINLKQSRSTNEIARRVDIVAPLNKSAEAQYGKSELSSYAKTQLDLLFKKFPDYRKGSKNAAAEIALLWETPSSQDRSSGTNDVALLIWQTYHCLLADHHPLPREESERKRLQLHRLGKVLDELDREVARLKPDMPESILAAIRGEAKQGIERLNESAASPTFPLLYYPLHDAAFEKTMKTVEAKVQEDIKKFIEKYSTRSKQTQDAAKDLKSEMAGKALAAFTMGNIVRHYCIMDRNLIYSDPIMFPFSKVTGAGVTYKMQEGLTINLGLEAI